eukprot:779378-Pelagomonas_calceolata.AAC.4
MWGWANRSGGSAHASPLRRCAASRAVARLGLLPPPPAPPPTTPWESLPWSAAWPALTRMIPSCCTGKGDGAAPVAAAIVRCACRPVRVWRVLPLG